MLEGLKNQIGINSCFQKKKFGIVEVGRRTVEQLVNGIESTDYKVIFLVIN
jgi:hypothetical protein